MTEKRRVYLVRHGHAMAAAADSARPLSERGREMVARVAEWLANEGARVHEIRHSQKRRALETAEIFALQLKPTGGTRGIPGLAPNDSVREMAKALDSEKSDIMLVGHLPFMGNLAALLVDHNPERAVVSFPEAGLACLEYDGALWSLKFAVSPATISKNRV
jgi:phosphohistidine phosphatase